MSTNYIDQITDTSNTTHDISEGDSTRIFRATCATAAGTTAKVATLQTSNRNFTLATGVRVAVTFTYGNTATTPTLRVDGSSTGTAKTIAVATSATTKATGNGTTFNTWGPYETVIFTYDGTYWVNGGSSRSIYNAYQNSGSELPDNTGSSTTGITVSAHSTGTVRGVKSNTNTTASKASGSNGSAPSLTVTSTTVANSLTGTIDSSDSTMLVISLGTTSVGSASGWNAGSASTWSFTDVTVPIRADSDSTFVTSTTHTVNDPGHTHSL